MAWRAGWSRRTCGVSRLCGALSLVVAAAATTQAELRSGLLTAIQGEVPVERAGHASALGLERSNAVFVGDRIKTGERSQARISLRSEVELLVRERTLVRLEPDERGHAITVERGNVAALIRAAGAEIRAPTVIAQGQRTFVEIAVGRGPSSAEKAETTICVLHGWTRAHALGGDAVTIGIQECTTLAGNVWDPVRSASPAEVATMRGAYEKILFSRPGSPDQAQIDALRHACEGPTHAPAATSALCMRRGGALATLAAWRPSTIATAARRETPSVVERWRSCIPGARACRRDRREPSSSTGGRVEAATRRPVSGSRDVRGGVGPLPGCATGRCALPARLRSRRGSRVWAVTGGLTPHRRSGG
jgi:hypothetical protein